jgi:hypothetical protein
MPDQELRVKQASRRFFEKSARILAWEGLRKGEAVV